MPCAADGAWKDGRRSVCHVGCGASGELRCDDQGITCDEGPAGPRACDGDAISAHYSLTGPSAT